MPPLLNRKIPKYLWVAKSHTERRRERVSFNGEYSPKAWEFYMRSRTVKTCPQLGHVEAPPPYMGWVDSSNRTLVERGCRASPC